MPLVSVILPTRDRPALLPRAVASVLAQTERDLELIVVDNNRAGPPVTTAHHDARWLADPRLRVVAAGGARTAAAARNLGLAVARGTFVAYLDDDDAYRPAKLARQLALADADRVSVVLCGAAYHLRGRVRCVQCAEPAWSGDDLLLRARWGTPFLLHRALDGMRFDETLEIAEDLEFGLRLARALGLTRVPVVAAPLVDVFPQTGPRVNAAVTPRRQAAARVLNLNRQAFSRAARRRYVLQTLLAIAKLSHRPAACAGLSWRLLRESRGADWRACANACAVGLRVFPGRWVS